jgi:cation diffusion facilitator CzcD-associated flavoprotein CzcO
VIPKYGTAALVAPNDVQKEIGYLKKWATEGRMEKQVFKKIIKHDKKGWSTRLIYKNYYGQTVRDDPQTVRDDPQTVRDDPQTVRDDPQTVRDDPQIVKQELKEINQRIEDLEKAVEKSEYIFSANDHPEIIPKLPRLTVLVLYITTF